MKPTAWFKYRIAGAIRVVARWYFPTSTLVEINNGSGTGWVVARRLLEITEEPEWEDSTEAEAEEWLAGRDQNLGTFTASVEQFHASHNQADHGNRAGRFSSAGKKLAEKYQSRPRDLASGDVVRIKPPRTTDRNATRAGNTRLVVDRVDREPYSVTVHFETGEKYRYDNSDGAMLDVEVWEDVEPAGSG